MTMVNDAMASVIVNLIVTIPPTIMALAALRSSQRVERQVKTGEDTPTIAEAAISSESTLRIATAILDRMDERLSAVEKGQTSHEIWHAAGMPERRRYPRD